MVSSRNERTATKKKKRSNKLTIIFDEDKRREFLTGFHKRKLQRKKKAQDELTQQLKDERKRLKTEAKESYKRLVVSHRPVPEVEHLLNDNYEDEDVTVRVTELSTAEIAKENNWIGANQPVYESDTEGELAEEQEDVPGMALKAKRPTSKKDTETKSEFRTERDVKKILKKQATKNVQKSKVFQMKNKIERQKQRKKSQRLKKERLKVIEKKTRPKINNRRNVSQ